MIVDPVTRSSPIRPSGSAVPSSSTIRSRTPGMGRPTRERTTASGWSGGRWRTLCPKEAGSTATVPAAGSSRLWRV
ncbi:hypothetical protein STENM327S_01942 [Streptomyces tendae]